MKGSWRDRVRPWVPRPMLAAYRRLRRAGENGAATTDAGTVDFELPVAPLAQLFPGADSLEVLFPAAEICRTRDMVLPLADLLSLAAICRQLRPRRVFEFGTYTGSTTLLLAMNTPDDCEIITLDLPGEAIRKHFRFPYESGCRFRNRPVAPKIRQLIGYSGSFDHGPYEGTIDLVYVDADHEYTAVKQDTETAFRLLAPRGVIVWDDYVWLPEHSMCAGVTRCLNELNQTKPCHQLEGTRLAVYRAPPAPPFDD